MNMAWHYSQVSSRWKKRCQSVTCEGVRTSCLARVYNCVLCIPILCPHVRCVIFTRASSETLARPGPGSLCTPGLRSAESTLAENTGHIIITNKNKTMKNFYDQGLIFNQTVLDNWKLKTPKLFPHIVFWLSWLCVVSGLRAGAPGRAARLSRLCGRGRGYFWSSSTILDSAEQILRLKIVFKQPRVLSSVLGEWK